MEDASQIGSQAHSKRTFLRNFGDRANGSTEAIARLAKSWSEVLMTDCIHLKSGVPVVQEEKVPVELTIGWVFNLSDPAFVFGDWEPGKFFLMFCNPSYVWLVSR